MEYPQPPRQETHESPIEAFRRKKAEQKQRLAAAALKEVHGGPRSYADIRAEHPDTPENYERFKGEYQPVTYRENGKIRIERNEVWDDQYVREQYIREADELIGHIDGSITERDNDSIYDERLEEGESRVPDTVLYLDKSARPVSWIVDAFYDDFAKEGVPKPKAEFLNIDRANWFSYLGHTMENAESRLGPEDFDINDVDPDRIAAIRAYFVEGDLSEDTWKDDVWNMPTRLDGQHLLIVDEVKNKGGTLHIAVELLRKAIPELTVDGTYFWHTSRVSIDGRSAEKDAQQMATAPLWYSKQRVEGRDVGDITPQYFNHKYDEEPTQENLRNKIASFAVSPPLHNPATFEPVTDKLAQKFKQDIAYMTYDLADGKLIRIPSIRRGADEIFRIMKDQGLSEEEAKTVIQGRSRNNRDT